MKNYRFKFSVIIPVYNVEAYLEETLESVINQTIGFEENIQIILVNDGSPDNSGEICEKYKRLYPNNIEYIVQENAGVSAARNAGIEFVDGKYLNFLDSDDKWELDTFQAAYDFFEKNYSEIDVLCARIKFFGNKTSYHVLDYKFAKGDRIVDIREDENSNLIQISAAASIIKSEALTSEYRFSGGIKYGEDALFITPLVLKKCKIGIMKTCLYYYRRRDDLSSAVQTQHSDPDFYLLCPEAYYLGIINYSIKRFGRVIPYVQNIVYYDLGWHLFRDSKKVLTDEQNERFLELMRESISYVDDEIIVKNRIHTDIYKKRIAFNFKHPDKDFLSLCTLNKENGSIDYDGYTLFTLKRSRCVLNICFFKINKKNIVVEGLIAKWLLDMTQHQGRLFFKVGKNKFKVKIHDYSPSTVVTCTGNMQKQNRFTCKIPLDGLFDNGELIRIIPFIKFGKDKCRLGMQYGKFLPSCNDFADSYTVDGNYYIKFFRTVIKVTQFSSIHKLRIKKITSELKCLSLLRKKKKKDIARLRVKYFLYKKRNPDADKIWLISDRVDNAGDNGEVFFKYLNKIKPKEIRPIFAISKNSACAERLQSEGEVVFVEDEDFLLYFLLADKIISSGASEFTINPFGKNKKLVSDLFRFKYYYLQHGVACADLSKWLHRYAKNISMIFASGENEHQAFLDCDYYYGKGKVALTGQARFDELYDDTQKQILILPTWRRCIKQSYDKNTTSVYFDGFRETEYFKFYNSLINDKRLLDVMRKLGYKGLFCIHPIHKEQWIDFEANDIFSINDGYVDYNKVFAESALMVTDYSSVLFDFAYLRKSVVYTQFDKEEFFAGQIYDEGYFSYEENGFGPVCYDYDSTVDAIIEYIENDCKNPQKYVDRVNDFFAFSDQNNCERIYNAIIGKK